MRKIWYVVFIFTLMIGVLFGLSNDAYAKEEFYENGYTYTIDDKNEATIIDVDSSVVGEITVPKSLGGANVARIGEYAFNNSKITSVSIPDNIVFIGEAAFLQCINLEKVYISNSVSQIGDLCFLNCKKLQYIDVSDSNENYSSDSYGVLFDKHKTRLIIYPIASDNDEYVIPSTVKIIEEQAFFMGDLGFNLKKLVLQEGIEEIRREAFYNNQYIEEFYVPSTVSYIDSTAFDYCINIRRFVVDKDNKHYYSDDAGALLDIDGKNLIRFPSNSLADSYVIPSGIEMIQENAFRNCSNISEVTLPQSCVSIGESAFESSSLKYISVNGGLKDIGRTAFLNCALLTRINIPYSVEKIDKWAFMNCSSLEMFSVDDNNDKYFSDEFGALFDKINKKLLHYPIGNKSHTYILFDGTTEICDSAFMYAKYLKKIELPNTVTIIEDNAFYGCEKIEDVYYVGNSEQWNAMAIGINNESLTDATIHYNHEPHSHSYTSEITKETSCIVSGIKTYTCSCTYSYAEEIPALGHDKISHKAKAPTCTEKGYEAYETCSRCDYTTYKEVAATGHNHKTAVTTPTCTDGGYTTYTCDCGDTYVSDEVESIGHDKISHEAKAPTCTEKGWEAYETCSRCDYTTYKEVAATGHNHKTAVTTPTCTDEGYTTYICDCGDIYVSDEVESLGHDKISHEAKASTCTEKGYEAYETCSRCDYTTYKEVAATGHNHKAAVTTPSCTDEGYTTYTCDCGDTYVDDRVAALEHGQISKVEEIKVPVTYSTSGSYDEIAVCGRCGTELSRETKEIPALWLSNINYSFVNGVLTVSGSGEIPSLENTSEYPWSQYADTTEIIKINNVSSIASKAFVGFSNVRIIIFNGDSISVESNAFYGVESLVSVVSFSDVELSGEVFTGNVEEFELYLEKSKKYMGSLDVTHFELVDGRLIFDGSVSVSADEFIKLTAIMCNYYDKDIEVFEFSSFTANDFYIIRWLDADRKNAERAYIIDHAEFRATLDPYAEKYETITFNEMYGMILSGEVNSFYLVVDDFDGNEYEEKEVTTNIFVRALKAIKAFIDWLVQLFS